MLLRLKIRPKLLLLVLGMDLGITVAFSVYVYTTLWRDQRDAVDRQLLTGAWFVRTLLPDEYHARIENETSVSPDEYIRYRDILTDFARANGFNYLYAFMEVHGTVVHTASSATREELQSGAWSHFFEPYEADELTRKAFDTKAPQYGESEDVFGRWRSVLLPVRVSSGQWYLAGADISLDSIHAQQRRVLFHCVLMGTLIFLAFGGVSVIFAGRIAVPLVQLADDTRALAAHDFVLTLDTQQRLSRLAHARGDEIGELAAEFLGMDQTLKQYLTHLEQTTAAKERIESELAIAHNIQMSFLRKSFPAFPGRTDFDINAAIVPARHVGGDFYDFFLVDDGLLWFTVGDVSEKGVPAALFMAVTMTLMRGFAEHERNPAEVLARTNLELCARNESMMFVTVFCGLLDLRTGELRFSNAGHNPPFLVPENGPAELLTLPPGVVLGVLEETAYRTGTLYLAPRDLLFAYTDGITEAMDMTGHLFGEDRLRFCLDNSNEKTPAATVTIVLQAVRSFTAGAAQSDDLTLLAIRRLPEA